MMDPELFKTLVDQAVEHKCRAITLASRGEPTLHKRLGEMLAYCKGKFFELKINSNATKLTERMCYEILDAGVDIVVFSVDSSDKEEYEKIRVGGRFEEVLANIRKFHAIRNSNPTYTKTAIRLSGVDLGIQDKDEYNEFWKDLGDNVSIGDTAFRWDTYNNPLTQTDRPCNVLWQRMYVWWDGTCNPCDYDYKSELRVGNAKETALTDIWLGKQFTKHREMHLAEMRDQMLPCNRCNMF